MADTPRLLYHDPSSAGVVSDGSLGGDRFRDDSPVTSDFMEALRLTVNRAAQGALGGGYDETDMDTLEKTISAIVQSALRDYRKIETVAAVGYAAGLSYTSNFRVGRTCRVVITYSAYPGDPHIAEYLITTQGISDDANVFVQSVHSTTNRFSFKIEDDRQLTVTDTGSSRIGWRATLELIE